MKFRPCIDIHNGKVKQIVGSSLSDTKEVVENFVSQKDAAWYAKKYRNDGLLGGHIILLNSSTSKEYEEDVKEAKKALAAFPFGMQLGGGVCIENAKLFLEEKASHVIVTSYVFREGKIDFERLKELALLVGKERIVLDLSCRKVGEQYFIVTDRWQKLTQTEVKQQVLEKLSEYCDEFLIHAVDVEGKCSGIEEELVRKLGEYKETGARNYVTYAGGVSSMEDLVKLKEIGKNKVDVTIGSALDLFGGTLSYEKVIQFCKN